MWIFAIQLPLLNTRSVGRNMQITQLELHAINDSDSGVLAVMLLLHIILDNLIFKTCTRYLFTPYLVLIWALAGIVYKIWDVSEPTALFAGAVLILATGKWFHHSIVKRPNLRSALLLPSNFRTPFRTLSDWSEPESRRIGVSLFPVGLIIKVALVIFWWTKYSDSKPKPSQEAEAQQFVVVINDKKKKTKEKRLVSQVVWRPCVFQYEKRFCWDLAKFIFVINL